MAENITVREAQRTDYPAIQSLMKKFSLETKEYQFWKALWEQNPAQRPSWPLGWVLCDADRVVGFLGNIPQHFAWQGRTLTAAVAHSWVVEEPYRSRSIALVMSYFRQSNVDLFLNTTARIEVAKVFSALKAVKVPIPYYDRALFWITNALAFTKSFLQRKGIPGASFFAYPLSLGVSFLVAMKTKPLRTHIPGKMLHRFHSFDHRFDIFWEKLKKKTEKFLALRDYNALQWHFSQALAQKNAWIFAITSAEDPSILLGYAVFFRQDNASFKLSRIRLADLQILQDEKECLEILLAAGLELCRREKIAMLEAVGFDEIKRKLLCEIAPFQRTLETWPYYFKATDKSLEENLMNPNLWDPSIYDGDASL